MKPISEAASTYLSCSKYMRTPNAECGRKHRTLMPANPCLHITRQHKHYSNKSKRDKLFTLSEIEDKQQYHVEAFPLPGPGPALT